MLIIKETILRLAIRIEVFETLSGAILIYSYPWISS